jgi:hypothetical protein
VCHHSSVSLNKEKIFHEISEDKIAVCKKTQGLRSGNFSDLNSACSKVLVPIKIFQFHDMHYEIERYREAANGLQFTRLLSAHNKQYLNNSHYIISKNNMSMESSLNVERNNILYMTHFSMCGDPQTSYVFSNAII